MWRAATRLETLATAAFRQRAPIHVLGGQCCNGPLSSSSSLFVHSSAAPFSRTPSLFSEHEAGHHGPPKVNFSEDLTSPSKWKEEHDTKICSFISSNNCQESFAMPFCKQLVASSFHDIVFPSKVEKVVHNKKISELLQKYTQVFVCLADNVTSNQLQSIRRHLRPDSVVLMGKNTVMKRSMEMYGRKCENTSYESMIPLLVGNVALIFTKGNMREVCEKGALIAKFGIRPLSRGLIVKAIYGGGSVFDPTVLDLVEDESVENVSAVISLWQPFFSLSTIL